MDAVGSTGCTLHKELPGNRGSSPGTNGAEWLQLRYNNSDPRKH
jgi:hypothetical protein